jgi:hypothetical protein
VFVLAYPSNAPMSPALNHLQYDNSNPSNLGSSLPIYASEQF